MESASPTRESRGHDEPYFVSKAYIDDWFPHLHVQIAGASTFGTCRTTSRNSTFLRSAEHGTTTWKEEVVSMHRLEW